VIAECSLVVAAAGPGLAGDAGVQVEQAADLAGGQRDELAAIAIGYEKQQAICSRRGERK